MSDTTEQLAAIDLGTEITEPGALLESTVEKAIRRLDAKPDPTITCWNCGHTDTLSPELAKLSADPLKHSLRCDDCGASTTVGVPMPLIAIVPHVDRRFVVSKVRQGKGDKQVEIEFTLERGFAAEYAMELLSVCDPVRWRAVTAIAAIERATRAAEQGGGVPTEGGRTLDRVE